MAIEPTETNNAENNGTCPTADSKYSEERLTGTSNADVTFPLPSASQKVDTSETSPIREVPAPEETSGIAKEGLSIPPSVQLYEKAQVQVRHLRAKIEE